MPTNVPSARLSRPLLALALLLPGALAVALSLLPWAQSIEARLQDAFLRATEAPEKCDRSIAVALLDDDGANKLSFAEDGTPEPWPWPRNAWGVIAKHLRALGAKAVLFDLVISDPSRREVRNEDDEFGAALKEAGACYVAVNLLPSRRPVNENPEQQAKALALRQKFFARMKSARGRPAPYADLLIPIEPLIDGAAGFGFVNVPPDPDGIIRGVPLSFSFEAVEIPSFTLAAAANLWGGGQYRIEHHRLFLGDRQIPLDSQDRLRVRPYGKSFTYDVLPLGSIVRDAIDRISDEKASVRVPVERIRDRVIVVGVSLAGLEDVVGTSVEDAFLGPELHALVLDHLKNGGALVPVAEPWRAAIAIAAGAVAVLLVLSKLKPSLGYALIGVVLMAVIGGVFLALEHELVLDVFAPSLALVLGTATGGGVRAATEGRRNKWLESTFRLYLSPAVIDRLKKDPGRLHLGGARREVTVMFSDIAGFTSISEKLKPEDLASLLNQYLSSVTDCLLETGATLDKYIGDAVMAFFGDPIDQPDHADRALRVAAAHKGLLQALAPELRRLGIERFDVRIGIHTGDAVLGNFGSSKRFAYTAMGDNVNLASRLEGLNKYFGTHVLLTEQTRKRVTSSEFQFREIGLIAVKGKQEPARVFELLPAGASADPHYVEGLRLYRQGKLAEAKREFAQGSLAGDGATRFYLERIKDIEAGEHEPDAGGVLVMEGK
ncbi:MAG: adenylate/guanylate cyclase domain-containing protein [Planctomycetota bacterium]